MKSETYIYQNCKLKDVLYNAVNVTMEIHEIYFTIEVHENIKIVRIRESKKNLK